MALLALKTGAPVIPMFLVREPSGFKAKILPEIPLIRTGDKIKDLEANTAQYNRVIESIVRQYPDQWFWVHRRWKTRPFYPWPRGDSCVPETEPKKNRSQVQGSAFRVREKTEIGAPNSS